MSFTFIYFGRTCHLRFDRYLPFTEKQHTDLQLRPPDLICTRSNFNEEIWEEDEDGGVDCKQRHSVMDGMRQDQGTRTSCPVKSALSVSGVSNGYGEVGNEWENLGKWTSGDSSMWRERVISSISEVGARWHYIWEGKVLNHWAV